ncbi:MAG: hypothetical protein DMF89_00645 [Acidobacteria bacterium]|nr:MAG: hypothetical protein DMF89_00645 [Acidobacteriota bacterium]
MTPRWTALLTVATSFVPLAALDAPHAERLLSRRYDEGERVQYVMKGQNDGSTYEVLLRRPSGCYLDATTRASAFST